MIPVFEPEISQRDIEMVTKALQCGEISGTFGKILPDFEHRFAAYCGMKHGVAVSSGTTALHLAVAAAGIGAGDEVLVSASTNIATALAVVHNNATPIPVDSETDTWNMDLDLLETLISPTTKAIIPVHLFGHPVDMDRLMKIADRHDLLVIEDCAEAHGAECRGRKVGGFGHMNCFSFYANKIMTTGEGGMIITDDETFAEKLRSLRNLAFTEPRFLHKELGYNFRMTGMQAALGLGQLERIDALIEGKRTMAAAYNRLLSDVDGVTMPKEMEWAKNVYWMYAVTFSTPQRRAKVMEALRQNHIGNRTFFCPMNIQPCLMEQPGYRAISCPVAEKIWETGLYLPSSVGLPEKDIAHVAETIHAALN